MSDEQVNMESILRRVQKLLAIAQDGRADPNEAAAAAQQAEKIMRKYQLTHADAIRQELKAKNAITTGDVFANMKRDDPKRPPLEKNPPWGQHLAVALARLNDCEVSQAHAVNKFGHHGAALRFHGYHADVQVAVWMFDYLVGATIAGVKRFNAERRAEGNPDKAASHAFRSGFMTTLTARIYKQAYDKEQEARSGTPALAQEDEGLVDEECEAPAQSQGPSTALVLVEAKKAAIAEVFGKFKYRNSRNSTVNDEGAYVRGMREARNVDLNTRGISSSRGASAGAIK